MIKLLTIIGARPQIIKAAAISREIAENFSDKIKETILHTGQHYDENMSGLFFTELGIPEPDINLNVGSASHGKMTAKIISGVEEVFSLKLLLLLCYMILHGWRSWKTMQVFVLMLIMTE